MDDALDDTVLSILKAPIKEVFEEPNKWTEPAKDCFFQQFSFLGISPPYSGERSRKRISCSVRLSEMGFFKEAILVSLNLQKLRDIVLEEAAKNSLRPARKLPSGLEQSSNDLPLEELDELKDCRRRFPRETHRRRLGGLAKFTKKAFAKVFRPFIHDAFETQSRFNEQTFEAFLILERRHRAIAARLAALEAIHASQGVIQGLPDLSQRDSA